MKKESQNKMNLGKHHWWWLGDGSVGLMLEPQGPIGSSLTSHIKKKKKIKLHSAGVGWGWGIKTGSSLVVRERDGDNLWDAEAALSLPFTFKKPKKSLLNQKAPVGYTTPLEVYLVSQVRHKTLHCFPSVIGYIECFCLNRAMTSAT